jgi:hypothetical protein
VSGNHDALQRCELPVDLGAQHLELALEPLQLAIDVDLALGPNALEIIDLPLQLEERLLEVQSVGRSHRGHPAFT